jgi:acid stress-induced BolA-like protein IbaG/YrbA
MNPDQIKKFIAEKMDCESLSVDGDGVHFEAVVVSSEFYGANRVTRHKMIYKILGDKMKAEIHALSIKAFTPEEWAEKLSGQV